MKGGLGALPTGLDALKIRVTSRPNGQCSKKQLISYPAIVIGEPDWCLMTQYEICFFHIPLRYHTLK